MMGWRPAAVVVTRGLTGFVPFARLVRRLGRREASGFSSTHFVGGRRSAAAAADRIADRRPTAPPPSLGGIALPEEETVDLEDLRASRSAVVTVAQAASVLGVDVRRVSRA